jgi:hypothetical protein
MGLGGVLGGRSPRLPWQTTPLALVSSCTSGSLHTKDHSTCPHPTDGSIVRPPSNVYVLRNRAGSLLLACRLGGPAGKPAPSRFGRGPRPARLRRLRWRLLARHPTLEHPTRPMAPELEVHPCKSIQNTVAWQARLSQHSFTSKRQWQSLSSVQPVSPRTPSVLSSTNVTQQQGA